MFSDCLFTGSATGTQDYFVDATRKNWFLEDLLSIWEGLLVIAFGNTNHDLLCGSCTCGSMSG